MVRRLKSFKNPPLFIEFLELSLRTRKCDSEDTTRNTQSYLTTVGYIISTGLVTVSDGTETDVEGNDRDPLKVLYDNLPGITEDSYNRYSEINTSLGLDLNTRPPKLQPHPLTAIFVNE